MVNSPRAANTSQIGKEKGAWLGGEITRGGNEKKSAEKPRRAFPARGRAARTSKATTMGQRFVMALLYAIQRLAKGANYGGQGRG